MIPIKTKEEIEIMKEGGRRLEKVFAGVLPEIKAGITKIRVDQIAEGLILKANCLPSFKMVPGYRFATCVGVNREVVHGIPDDYIFREGDFASLDIGVFFNGFNLDASRTVFLGEEAADSKEGEFLAAGKRALAEAVASAQKGKRVGHISQAINRVIEESGFRVVRSLTGHGVGRKLHEEPMIPGFLTGKPEDTPLLEEGMVLAIEVIYTQGNGEVVLTSDGWTVETKDAKIAALFEESVAITSLGPLILTNGSSGSN